MHRQARARSNEPQHRLCTGYPGLGPGRWPAIGAKATRTQNARQALDYVAHAEVDATFACATDALIRKDGVVFTMATEIPTTFHIAVVEGTAEARRFVGYVRSPPGQAILVRHGHLPP